MGWQHGTSWPHTLTSAGTMAWRGGLDELDRPGQAWMGLDRPVWHGARGADDDLLFAARTFTHKASFLPHWVKAGSKSTWGWHVELSIPKRFASGQPHAV